MARKLYTFLLIVPIGAGILMFVVLISLIPVLYNMPLIAVVIWLVLTVLGAAGMIILKHKNLKQSHWFDLIPPSILLYIGYNYAIFGFLIGHPELGLLMLLTGIPLLLAFIFTLRK